MGRETFKKGEMDSFWVNPNLVELAETNQDGFGIFFPPLTFVKDSPGFEGLLT